MELTTLQEPTSANLCLRETTNESLKLQSVASSKSERAMQGRDPDHVHEREHLRVMAKGGHVFHSRKGVAQAMAERQQVTQLL